MSTIVINGKTFKVDSSSSVSILGNKIVIENEDGRLESELDKKKIEIRLEGSINTLTCDESIKISGGTIHAANAKGSINCDNVAGNVSAGGSVNCDNIDGDVSAGGSVNADKIKGNVTAGGSVRT